MYGTAQMQLDARTRVAGSAPEGDISTGMRVPAGIFLCRAKPACNECGYFKNTRTCCMPSSILRMSD